MTSHILSLTALHAAAPGVLDVVFGPDGDFEGAPRWTSPIWGSVTRWGEERPPSFVTRWTRNGADFVTPEWDGNAGVRAPSLDLRIPTVAARLAGLCERAADSETYRNNTALLISAFRASAGAWFDDEAARLAALTLALAPRIAALGGGR